MNQERDAIADAAAAWYIASIHDDMDWDGFTAWLEADPRHQAAYDEVALADALLDEHRPALSIALPANDEAERAPPVPVRRRWAAWTGAAIAASLALVLAVPQFSGAPAQRYRTGAQSQEVALADGSRVLLAPRSSLEVSGRGDRIELAGGAWFDIRHDPSRELAISAGGVKITDIGTRFDVQADAGRVRVEVAEGQVSVSSPELDAPVRLTQGRSFDYDGVAGTAVSASIAAADIGEWRSGRLTYDASPLALVANDLARYAGKRVTLGSGLADRQFSGTLALGDGEAALRDLSQLMGLRLVRGPDGDYRLERPR